MSDERTMPPNDLDSVRDEVAKMNGWNRCGAAWIKETAAPPGRRAGVIRPPDNHPFPATRDGAASAMPEGWLWRKCGVPSQWNAAKSGDCWVDGVCVLDTGDEIADRYRLARLALRRDGK